MINNNNNFKRERFLSLLFETLKDLDPAILVKTALEKHVIQGEVSVLSLGKSALKMAQGVLDYGIVIKNSLVIIPHVLKIPDNFPLKIIVSSHPLPDDLSLKAGEEIVKFAYNLNDNDLLIILISGGGSSLVSLPEAGLNIEDLQQLNSVFIKNDIPIKEMNTVRKHVSAIKGGKLLKYIRPCKSYTFLISDVPVDTPEIIASGLTYPDDTDFSDALEILHKRNINNELKNIENFLEKGVSGKITETPDSWNKIFSKNENEIIVDRKIFSEKLYEKFSDNLQMNIEIPHYDIDLSVEDTIKFLKKLRKKNKVKTLYIISGEMTVKVSGKGYGGRNQELIMRFIDEIKENELLISFATDGVDGICPEDVAGAFMTKEISETIQKSEINFETYVKNNDSYTLLNQFYALIKSGATGHNLGDLILFYT